MDQRRLAAAALGRGLHGYLLATEKGKDQIVRYLPLEDLRQP